MNSSYSSDTRINDPICIVGMGCVLPGAASVETFWENVLNGRSALDDVPADRWDPDAHYDPDPTTPDKTYAIRGGFVDNTLLREIAFHLDVDWNTHHRLAIMAMEACRQTVGDFPADVLQASKIDVILGCMAVDESIHLRLLHRDVRAALDLLKSKRPEGWEQAIALIDGYFDDRLRANIPERDTVLTTSVLHALKQRYGLNGEGAIIDAACASSLAAIDIAAERLRDRRCDIALTGGLEGDLGAATFVLFSKVGALAKEYCYPFDARTEGLVQGEGAVIFALQRLDDALAQGRQVHGIIAGCGSASDGRSGSLFSPTSAGQQLAFKRAYQQAGEKAPDYVECHGTGTQLGDATELASLNAYFAETSISIGSVKALIGHTKGAAGAAGLLKAVLAMRHGIIPPSPYFSKPLPNVGKIAVHTSPVALPSEHGRPARRFGVSSFGFGNINYHLVLDELIEELPVKTAARPSSDDDIVVLGSIDVSDVDVGGYLAKARLNIPPNSLPQTDRYQLLAVIGTLEVFKAAGISLSQIDRDSVCVIAASCLCLPSTQAFDNRVNYDDLLLALDPLGDEVLDVIRQRKERLAKVSEDTGPGILNNVIAGKVCNVFDFKGKSFNVDADFMSVPVALDLAGMALRKEASLALILCPEERMNASDTVVERDRFSCILLTTKRQAQHNAYPIEGILEHVSYQETAHR